MTTTILPSNSTPWERAVEQVSAERWEDLDVDIIRRARDPWTCPEHLLPQLAYQRSVDVWDERWPVEKKRQVIADAPEDHRRKGTYDGIDRYVRHAGGTMLRATTPPQGFYLVDELSEDEREAYLAGFDQVRVYRHFPVEFQGDGFYLDAGFCDEGGLDSEPVGHGYRKRAVLRKPDGNETELDFIWQQTVNEEGESVEIETIVLPAPPDGGFFLDEHVLDESSLDPDNLGRRIIEVATPGAYALSIDRPMFGTAMPEGLASGTMPQLITEPLPGDGIGMMLDVNFLDEGAVMEDQSWRHVYERIYVADPARGLPSIDAGGSYLDVSWMDWDAYTALIQVRQTKKYHNLGAEICLDDGYLLPDDLEDFRVLQGAVGSAQALRDRVYINTTTYREPTFGDRLPLNGSWSLGQLIEDR